MDRLRVLFADDDTIFREAMALLLSQAESIHLIAAVPDGAKALDIAGKYHIDIALLDVDMPVVDGVEAIRSLRKISPQTKVVMLTAFEQRDALRAAIMAGAHGFLTKDLSSSKIIEMLWDVHKGSKVMGPRPIELLTESYAKTSCSNEAFVAAVATLSPRLLSVFELVIQAVPNKTIARKLNLSENTVRGYVSEILQVTNCSSRSEVAVTALREGFGQ